MKKSDFIKTIFGKRFNGRLAIFEKPGCRTRFYESSQLKKISGYIKSKMDVCDIYFGMGLQDETVKKGRGDLKTVIGIPGFWLDIDIEDFGVVQEILQKFPHKPSLIVGSGNGFHAYWLFNEVWYFTGEEDKNQAVSASKAFQKRLLDIFRAEGYTLDNTADLTRVLRVPGTYNHKDTLQKKVTVVEITDFRYPRELIIKEIDQNVGAKAVAAGSKISGSMRGKQSAGSNGLSGNSGKASVKRILKRCAWFKHCRDDAPILTEAEWFAMLTVLVQCKNSRKWAKALSINYPSYSEKETLAKLKRIGKRGYFPASCSNISQTYGHCKGCKYYGKGIKNPVEVGGGKKVRKIDVGFKLGKNGEIVALNPNIFARFVLSRKSLVYSSGDIFYEYNHGVWSPKDRGLHELSREVRDILHEFAPDYWTPNLETAYMEALKREAPQITEFNTDRSIINLNNGVFDLSDFKLKDHSPVYQSSIQSSTVFDSSAKCPCFESFLFEVFEGDQEVIHVVQEIMGYSLTTNTSAQKGFFFYGSGENGKSILIDVIIRLVGQENISTIVLADLSKEFKRYELINKLLNVSSETDIPDKGVQSAMVKAIITGDNIYVEKKFCQGFNYKPVCKIIFSMNNLPGTKDRSHGFIRRIMIVPFNKRFSPDDPATRNYDELIAELHGEMSGILNFALEGLKRLQNKDYRFTSSKVINDAVNEYYLELNPYQAFVSEFITGGSKESRLFNSKLRTVFMRWCETNGHHNIKKTIPRKMHKELRKSMENLRIKYIADEKFKTGNDRYIKGVKFKTDSDCKSNMEDLFDND